MKLRKYTLEQLVEAIKTSISIREALNKLGIKSAGGNYYVINKAIKFYNLDVSHFSGSAWNRGKKFAPKRGLSVYTSNQHPIQSYKLKNRLISEGILVRECSVCSLTDWRGQPIPLELDHINGDHKDNSLENLRLLCPNCHALTPTYRGKNIKSPKLSSGLA